MAERLFIHNGIESFDLTGQDLEVETNSFRPDFSIFGLTDPGLYTGTLLNDGNGNVCVICTRSETSKDLHTTELNRFASSAEDHGVEFTDEMTHFHFSLLSGGHINITSAHLNGQTSQVQNAFLNDGFSFE